LAKTLLRNLHKERIWLLDNYVPELIKVMGDKALPVSERISLSLMFAGVVMKLFYAFIYQEEHIPVPGFLTLLIITIIIGYILNLRKMKIRRQKNPKILS